MITTTGTLVKLAALVWYSGGVILLFKSTGMVREAKLLGASPDLILLAALTGVILGWIKSTCLFERACKKNIDRILALASPKIWQFYRIRFFFFLCAMILFGSWAYAGARNQVHLLLGLAGLELSVSTALLISGRCFHTR